MERITSRKNAYIAYIKELIRNADERRAAGEFVCDGLKLLTEAVAFGAEVSSVLWKEKETDVTGLNCERQYTAPAELFDYASPMANSPGPVFTVKIPKERRESGLHRVIVLENVQDPGNVGTVIRTANAFGMDAVILSGACADLYNPKTVRATMGAIFRQNVIRAENTEIKALMEKNGLKLYGAVLSERAKDVLDTDMHNCAIAVGSEGKGLSREFIDICDGEIIIPMEPDSESLNAAVAASVLMWEMKVKG